MIPATFDYARPSSLEEALRLLGEHDDAKLLAGGHSLIPMMKLRLAEPALLVDLQGVPNLLGIHVDGNRVKIGALTTHATLAASAELKQHAPVLWMAANDLGDPQVRNRGTIGGAVAHGDPSADYPAVMLALDASFTLAGKSGTRQIGAAEFFRGMFDTALESGEILTEVAFDAAPHSAYAKYAHPASGYAVVGAAAVLDVEGGTIRSARLAVTGVGDAAYRAGAAEKALAGLHATDTAAIKSATAGVTSGVDSRSDSFASGAYRASMAAVYAARAVAAAAAG